MKNCSHIPFQLTAQICESSKILKSSVYRAKQFKTWFEYLKLSGTNIFRIPLFGGKLFFSSLIYPSSLRVCVCVLVTHSHSVTHQDPLSMDFSRQEYWVGCHSLLQGSSQPQDWIQVSCTAGKFFTLWATREAQGLSTDWLKKGREGWPWNSRVQVT